MAYGKKFLFSSAPGVSNAGLICNLICRSEGLLTYFGPGALLWATRMFLNNLLKRRRGRTSHTHAVKQSLCYLCLML